MLLRTIVLFKAKWYPSPSNFRRFSRCQYKTIQRFCTLTNQQNLKPAEESASLSNECETIPDPDENVDLSSFGSILPPTYTFAAYADKSVVLQEFIKLGVELYKLEKDLKVVKFLVQLNYEKHVKPHLLFLHDHGVPTDQLGKFITKNPLIFKEDLNDLEVRINYLKSKKFTKDMISAIILKYPIWLSLPVKAIDARLGYLQQTYNLKGDEVRKIILQTPRLANVKKKQLRINHYLFKEEFGLNDHQLKKLILEMPVLLRKDEYEIMKIFEFITKQMKVPLDLLLKQPIVLTHKVHIIKERHKYLETLGRAQYNPFLPGYVSLINLIKFTDEEFCEKMALTSVLSYNKFLKTQ